ncbi:MAG: DUF1501 domain-containing protein, partial [Gammaproteobacteria bacterium]|nr:DUF1501 domain-containing protein [Gammaproteobacteria bacterium]
LKNKSKQVDQPIAALIKDLKQRGLLVNSGGLRLRNGCGASPGALAREYFRSPGGCRQLRVGAAPNRLHDRR